MSGKENDLDLAFATKIKESPTFASWVLGHTKFAAHASGVRLLDQEQASLRPRKFWWKHWWCRVPELAEERETDVFVVLKS